MKPYIIPPTYHLGDAGCCCFGEPPNHPRYDVKSIYTQYGNSPPWGRPQYYLKGRGFNELEEVDKLFKPLPYDHPRVQAWERDQYAYKSNCYSPDGTTRAVDKCIIDPDREQPPEHHLAYLAVKEYYPEAEPRLDLIETPPIYGKGAEGHWWERHDNPPKPEECKGETWRAHPVNGDWCQVCGWVAEG